ncbi:N-acetylmuramoyl-L-alanine amidase [Microtetraspora sp. AC03309]|uniref:peptidoglycan recognition protein family protein n=1 Tax=Microtetraspora sp. AC03309 TaxID=2779376 RepID=UPI001E450B6D|nr:N-acetylmuramoyl-L-alanine amidase [Microtetraspora sp. AC03309]MCC5574462.1 N-acetylmuramoyl-L-alanine amidase [Microtetraspora sp. AC03309]
MKYVQAAKHGGSQTSVNRIVIHGTVSPCVRGGAKNVARYFQSPSAGGSAHYIVDPGEIVSCVREGTVAYHAPPNTGSVGIELCDPQNGSSARWRDDDHEAMLKLAADLVRQVAKRWDVPLRRLTVAELRSGKRGICGHVDISKAFGQTDHSDPGSGFPWGHFMALVLNEEAEPVKVVISDGVPQWPGRVLKVADPMLSGEDVKVWQAKLKARGWSIDVDGWYGPKSAAVAKGYQKATGLKPTGEVDKATWEMTWSWKPPQPEEPPQSGVVDAAN